MVSVPKEEKEPRQYVIRWNHFPDNILVNFFKSLTNKNFVDVTLACESQTVKCHKVVLSACSPYLEKILVDNPCSHPIIFMQDMKFRELDALVQFMYKGEVNILRDQLEPVMKAAEALQIIGLCSESRDLANLLTESPLVASSGNDKCVGDREDPRTAGTSGITYVENKVNGQNGVSTDMEVNEEPSQSNDASIPPENDASNHDGENNHIVTGIKRPRNDSDESDPADVVVDAVVEDHNYSAQDYGFCRVAEEPVNFRLHFLQSGDEYDENVWPLDYCTAEADADTESSKTQRTRRPDAVLREAATSVHDGMTFQEASIAYNIPMSTIRFYMARKGILPIRKRGRKNSSLNSA